jgi:hypothetical protein
LLASDMWGNPLTLRLKAECYGKDVPDIWTVRTGSAKR